MNLTHHNTVSLRGHPLRPFPNHHLRVRRSGRSNRHYRHPRRRRVQRQTSRILRHSSDHQGNSSPNKIATNRRLTSTRLQRIPHKVSRSMPIINRANRRINLLRRDHILSSRNIERSSKFPKASQSIISPTMKSGQHPHTFKSRAKRHLNITTNTRNYRTRRLDHDRRALPTASIRANLRRPSAMSPNA